MVEFATVTSARTFTPGQFGLRTLRPDELLGDGRCARRGAGCGWCAAGRLCSCCEADPTGSGLYRSSRARGMARQGLTPGLCRSGRASG
jgi:hypothetical protein